MSQDRTVTRPALTKPPIFNFVVNCSEYACYCIFKPRIDMFDSQYHAQSRSLATQCCMIFEIQLGYVCQNNFL